MADKTVSNTARTGRIRLSAANDNPGGTPFAVLDLKPLVVLLARAEARALAVRGGANRP